MTDSDVSILNKEKSIIMALVLALVICSAGVIVAEEIDAASPTYVDGLWYELKTSDNTAAVSNNGTYNQQALFGVVTIPSTFEYSDKTYTVNEIKANAFQNCSGITQVIAPSSVQSIGDYAFSSCESLKKVVVGDITSSDTTAIKEHIISGSNQLLEVIFYNAVIPAGGSWTFSFDDPLMPPSVETFVMPSTWTYVPKYCFYGASSLKAIITPADYENGQYTDQLSALVNIKGIERDAFNGCAGLSDFSTILGDNRELYMGAFALAGTGIIEFAPKLSELTFGQPHPTIADFWESGYSQLKGCNSLRSFDLTHVSKLTIRENKNVINKLDRTLVDCPNLREIDIASQTHNITELASTWSNVSDKIESIRGLENIASFTGIHFPSTLNEQSKMQTVSADLEKLRITGNGLSKLVIGQDSSEPVYTAGKNGMYVVVNLSNTRNSIYEPIQSVPDAVKLWYYPYTDGLSLEPVRLGNTTYSTICLTTAEMITKSIDIGEGTTVKSVVQKGDPSSTIYNCELEKDGFGNTTGIVCKLGNTAKYRYLAKVLDGDTLTLGDNIYWATMKPSQTLVSGVNNEITGNASSGKYIFNSGTKIDLLQPRDDAVITFECANNVTYGDSETDDWSKGKLIVTGLYGGMYEPTGKISLRAHTIDWGQCEIQNMNPASFISTSVSIDFDFGIMKGPLNLDTISLGEIIYTDQSEKGIKNSKLIVSLNGLRFNCNNVESLDLTGVQTVTTKTARIPHLLEETHADEIILSLSETTLSDSTKSFSKIVLPMGLKNLKLVYTNSGSEIIKQYDGSLLEGKTFAALTSISPYYEQTNTYEGETLVSSNTVEHSGLQVDGTTGVISYKYEATSTYSNGVTSGSTVVNDVSTGLSGTSYFEQTVDESGNIVTKTYASNPAGKTEEQKAQSILQESVKDSSGVETVIEYKGGASGQAEPYQVSVVTVAKTENGGTSTSAQVYAYDPATGGKGEQISSTTTVQDTKGNTIQTSTDDGKGNVIIENYSSGKVSSATEITTDESGNVSVIVKERDPGSSSGNYKVAMYEGDDPEIILQNIENGSAEPSYEGTSTVTTTKNQDGSVTTSEAMTLGEEGNQIVKTNTKETKAALDPAEVTESSSNAQKVTMTDESGNKTEETSSTTVNQDGSSSSTSQTVTKNSEGTITAAQTSKQVTSATGEVTAISKEYGEGNIEVDEQGNVKEDTSKASNTSVAQTDANGNTKTTTVDGDAKVEGGEVKPKDPAVPIDIKDETTTDSNGTVTAQETTDAEGNKVVVSKDTTTIPSAPEGSVLAKTEVGEGSEKVTSYEFTTIASNGSVTLSADNVTALKGIENDKTWMLKDSRNNSMTVLLDNSVISNLSSGQAVLSMSSVSSVAGLNDAQKAVIQNTFGGYILGVDLSLTAGGASVSKLNGKATVTIPVSQKVAYDAVYYLDNAGGLTKITNFTIADGLCTFETDHFSTYIVAPTTYSITLEQSAGGKITSTHTTQASGSNATVSVAADAGYSVSRVDMIVDGVTTDVWPSFVSGSYTFAVDKDVAFAPVFAASSYTISSMAGTGGSIAVAASAYTGETVNVTVTPDDNTWYPSTLTYTVAGGSSVAIQKVDGNYSFVMPAGNVTVSAYFTQVQKFDIEIQLMEHGTVTADTYLASAGDTITLTVVPDAGYKLKADSLVVKNSTGTETITLTGTTFTMPSKMVKVYAEFELETYSTTVGAGSSDASSYVVTGSVTGSVTVGTSTLTFGETVTIASAEGYSFSETPTATGQTISYDAATSAYTFVVADVDASIEIKIVTQATAYTVEVVSATGISVSQSGTTYSAGNVVTLTPASGAIIDTTLGTIGSSTVTYTVSPADADANGKIIISVLVQDAAKTAEVDGSAVKSIAEAFSDDAIKTVHVITDLEESVVFKETGKQVIIGSDEALTYSGKMSHKDGTNEHAIQFIDVTVPANGSLVLYPGSIGVYGSVSNGVVVFDGTVDLDGYFNIGSGSTVIFKEGTVITGSGKILIDEGAIVQTSSVLETYSGYIINAGKVVGDMPDNMIDIYLDENSDFAVMFTGLESLPASHDVEYYLVNAYGEVLAAVAEDDAYNAGDESLYIDLGMQLPASTYDVYVKLKHNINGYDYVFYNQFEILPEGFAIVLYFNEIDGRYHAIISDLSGNDLKQGSVSVKAYYKAKETWTPRGSGSPIEIWKSKSLENAFTGTVPANAGAHQDIALTFAGKSVILSEDNIIGLYPVYMPDAVGAEAVSGTETYGSELLQIPTTEMGIYVDKDNNVTILRSGTDAVEYTLVVKYDDGSSPTLKTKFIRVIFAEDVKAKAISDLGLAEGEELYSVFLDEEGSTAAAVTESLEVLAYGI